MSIYQCLVRAETPKFIPVADKPLRLGGKIEYLAIDAFQKRFGFEYNESILIDTKTKISPFNENITGNVPASQLKKQVEKILKVTSDNLVICNMGEFGHGVFASKEIPKNTVVAIYAGTIISQKKVSNAADHALGYYGTNMSFSTLQHRGVASFMQHLPEEPQFDDAKTFSRVLKMYGQNVSEDELKLNVELYSTEFSSPATKELIATENIRREYLNFNNIPLIAMVTNRDIQSGDQIGFNYGYEYWLSRNITSEYFDKNGNDLSWNLYKRTFGRLNFDTFSYTGEYKPLIDSLKQKRASITVIDANKKSHEVPAEKLTSLLLQVNAVRMYFAIKI